MTTTHDDTDDEAVAREEGRRAAARGDVYDNPYLPLLDAWQAGFTEVEAHRLGGKDRGGHLGSVPHMCLGATHAKPTVCNCCSTCAQGCAPGIRDTLRGAAATLLHRIGLRRIRP